MLHTIFFDEIHLSDLQYAWIYGQAELHKISKNVHLFPLTPLPYSIDTYEKCLCKISKPFVTYQHLMEKIQIHWGNLMVRFDVESFTNFVVYLIFKKEKNLQISKSELKTLFEYESKVTSLLII